MKRIGWICLLPAGVLPVCFLLYIPPIQDAVIGKVLASLSKSVGLRIQADAVRLTFPLKLSVRELSLTDDASDTLVGVRRFNVVLKPLPLLHGVVAMEGLHIEQVRLATRSWIDGVTIDGTAGELTIDAGEISPARERIRVHRLDLSDTDVALQIDSDPADTARNVNAWSVRLDTLLFRRVAFALRMPSDSLRMASSVETLALSEGRMDFGTERYGALQLRLAGAEVRFDVGPSPVTPGPDRSHIAFAGVYAGIDSLFWQKKDLRACVRSFSACERSGWVVTAMQGSVKNDTAALSIPRWTVQTPSSTLSLQVYLPWQAMEKQSKQSPEAGEIRLELSLGRQDVFMLLGEEGRKIESACPAEPFTLSGRLEGNADRLFLRRLQGEWPGVFRMDADGALEKVRDRVRRSGHFRLTAFARAKPFLPALLPAAYAGRFALPDSLRLDVEAALEKEVCRTEALLAGLQGILRLAGRYDARSEDYFVEVKADSLAADQFLPHDSIRRLTASFRAEGRGTDLFADSARMQWEGVVSEMHLRNTLLSGISTHGSLRDHRFQATLASSYPEARGKMTLDGTIRPDRVAAMLIVTMDSLDLYGLKLTDLPLSNSFQLFSEMETDRKQRHRIDLTLGNWTMAMEKRIVKPKTMTLLARCNEDTTLLSFHSGDLAVTLTGKSGVERLLGQLNAVAEELVRQQTADSVFLNLPRLLPLWPDLRLTAEAARDNPVSDYLQEDDLFFDRFLLRASTSPETGVQAQALLIAPVKDTLKIDTVRIDLAQDSLGLRYTGEIIKRKFRRQEPFTAGWNGFVREKTAGLDLYYRNDRGEAGLQLGVRAERQPDGVRLHLLPDPVIAFLPFSVNGDNQVHLRKAREISANLRLTGKDNASIGLRSEEEDGALRELFFEINQIRLDQISGAWPGIPPMQGLTNLSLRYVPTADMIVADAGVERLTCRGGSIGDVLLNGVYLPLDDGNHQVDLHLFHNQKEIATLSALLRPDRNKPVEGLFEIHRSPLSLFNPFLAGTAQCNGALRGALNLEGTWEQPALNGYLQLDTATVYITAADTRLRFDTQRVEIKDSRIRFHAYELYTAGNNPFVIDGTVDLRNPARGTADLRLTANNMQLLNARKKRESIVYGKMFVNLNTTLRGPFASLMMRGELHLLDHTDLTCIVKASPPEVQDRMADLVTFSSFRDTVPRKDRRRPMQMSLASGERLPIEGLELALTVRLEPAVKLKIHLDEASSGQIELQGGGDLSFQYTRRRDMLLTGRYTLSGGLIRYNMPVIADKTLRIKGNSYIEWTGDPMNPFLNLKATERYHAYVNHADGQTPHLVHFDAGIELKQRMENPALQFTLDAVDDATLQEQLTALGAEERSKRAVSMLLTGMYLADDGTGKMRMDMGMAINSFLQTEINHITGSLLKGVDFNFGMESFDGTAGGTGRRTDYAFRFSKRFYNDRLNVILGGLVSTGDVPEESNTFINDAAIEYRLDAGGNRYARLFYNRQYESLLEGEITKYGAGVVFRRKMKRLIDLFTFRKRQSAIIE